MKFEYVKYLTRGNDDMHWELFLNGADSVTFSSYNIYPSFDHPSEYYFNRNDGRILKEFQINYITESEGILGNWFGACRRRGTHRRAGGSRHGNGIS